MTAFGVILPLDFQLRVRSPITVFLSYINISINFSVVLYLVQTNTGISVSINSNTIYSTAPGTF